MPGKRVGIKDIAEATHVSVGTVHRALNGKDGVGESTRQLILEKAKEMGYQPNINASFLKRKPLRIAGAFPAYTDRNQYYYSYAWKGFRQCIEEFADYNIEVIEVPYYTTQGVGSQRSELQNLWEEYRDLDGLVTIGHMSRQDAPVLKKFTDNNIAVALACDDMPGYSRLCCVQADYVMTGSMVAELLSAQIPADSQVLICAGDVDVQSHYQIVQGFDRYVEENGLNWELVKVFGKDDETEQIYEKVLHHFQQLPRLKAAYSVNARNSLVLCQAARKLGRTGDMRVVTSDLFPENIANLKDGSCCNISYKNPRQQAYLATKILLEYLMKHQKPTEDVIYVNSEIIFRSNVHVYEI